MTRIMRRVVLQLVLLLPLVTAFQNNGLQPQRSPLLNIRPPWQSSSYAGSSYSPSARKAVLLSMAAVPEIEKWRILGSGAVQGIVRNHPSIPDGDVITTSPLKAPNAVSARMVVTTSTGSKYKLLEPLETESSSSSSTGGTKTLKSGGGFFGGGAAKNNRQSPSIPVGASNLPLLDDWKLLDNDSLQGYVTNHPTIPNGQIITTSTLKNPAAARRTGLTVVTISGSKYKLGEQQNAQAASSSNSAPASSSGGAFNFFGSPAAAPKVAPAPAPAPAPPATTGKKEPTADELRKMRFQAQKDYGLNGETLGSGDKRYLLCGKSAKSTSGKSMIYKAFIGDVNGLPVDDTPVTVKVSVNQVSIEREARNYGTIAQSGLTRGKFVNFIEYLTPEAMQSNTGRSKVQCALVMERGDEDLKAYLARRRQMNGGGLTGKELRDAASAAAQCVQAVHQSGLVWTDLKTENFVVMADGEFRGIDLESAIPAGGNPVDYSPEACPPEFAQAFLEGDGPEFRLSPNYDIWSFGMMLYELGTGAGYFDGRSPIQITRALSEMRKIEIDPSVEEQLDSFYAGMIKDCLQVNPNRRPSIGQILLHPYFLTTGIGPFSF